MNKEEDTIELTEQEWRATSAWSDEHVKKQRIGDWLLCSFYLGVDDWNVWIVWSAL